MHDRPARLQGEQRNASAALCVGSALQLLRIDIDLSQY